jgi:aminopeptidase
VIDGIELEFQRGRVVSARARTGGDHLQRLLCTDEGACRLGEVALVGQPAQPASAGANWRNSGRLYYHTLLDENAASHIALGEAYPFCSSALFGFGLNRSLVHVDLPLDAQVTFG